MRSLSEPQYLNDPLFTSRVEFSERAFGRSSTFSVSGRDDAFVWPSIVRVGDEARALAMQRCGHRRQRYLQPAPLPGDETPALQDWRFSQIYGKTQREPACHRVSADESDER